MKVRFQQKGTRCKPKRLLGVVQFTYRNQINKTLNLRNEKNKFLEFSKLL